MGYYWFLIALFLLTFILVKINREGNFNKHSNDKYHMGGDFLSPKDSDSHSKDRSISPKRSIKLASISEEKEDN